MLSLSLNSRVTTTMPNKNSNSITERIRITYPPTCVQTSTIINTRLDISNIRNDNRYEYPLLAHGHLLQTHFAFRHSLSSNNGLSSLTALFVIDNMEKIMENTTNPSIVPVCIE